MQPFAGDPIRAQEELGFQIGLAYQKMADWKASAIAERERAETAEMNLVTARAEIQRLEQSLKELEGEAFPLQVVAGDDD